MNAVMPAGPPVAFLDSLLARQERKLVGVGLLAILTIGVVDYVTGYQFGFSIFYLFPVFAATIYVRKQVGIVISLASALVWLLTDFIAERSLAQSGMGEWDILNRLAFFALIAFSLISLQRNLREEQRLAKIDTLTGVGNIRAFNEFLRGLRRGPLTVAYLDCDNFKQVNDTRGHAQGDVLLKLIAQNLREKVRGQDLVARIGGDEFVLVLTEIDPLLIEDALDRLNRELAATVAAAGFPVTFSVGAVTYLEPAAVADHMIKEADDLMYVVKKSTKNRVAAEVRPARRQTDQP